MSPDGPLVDLVHAPIAQWAQTQGDAVAIRCGEHRLCFAELQQRLTQRAHTLAADQAPASVLVNTFLPVTERLIDFLGIVASGRCAVVGDPDWPIAVRGAVLAAVPTQGTSVPAPQANTPFYVGYTSGSTGTPKGYRRHHHSWTSSFQACIEAFGPDASRCVLVPGRDSQSLFLFGMLLGLWTGGGVEVQEQFSATAALHTLRSGRTPCLVAVPSQLLMLLDAAKHQNAAPMAAVRLILISGARWMRQRTPELRALFPAARIIEFYGASETSFVAWMDTDEAAPAAVVGWPFQSVELQIRDPQSEDSAGPIYVRSPMLFMDYVGGAQDATAALRDGDWICVRDLGYLDAQGRLCVVGRQNRMLVTLGKNLFPEEVESVLERHPAIASASVHGVPDALRGLQVVAILRWAPDATPSPSPRPDALALKAWCRQHLEGFKLPRIFFTCAKWCHTASGKTDHRALAQGLPQPDQATPTSAPCLNILP
jgi:acyl-CoA synthetase (AMP-forming)/AMP-acid ligase II